MITRLDSRIESALLFATAILAAASALKGTGYASVVETALAGCALCFVVLREPARR